MGAQPWRTSAPRLPVPVFSKGFGDAVPRYAWPPCEVSSELRGHATRTADVLSMQPGGGPTAPSSSVMRQAAAAHSSHSSHCPHVLLQAPSWRWGLWLPLPRPHGPQMSLA